MPGEVGKEGPQGKLTHSICSVFQDKFCGVEKKSTFSIDVMENLDLFNF